MPKTPPYTITEKAADYLAKIVEAVTRLEYDSGFKTDILLHRTNRIQTIHSSLAIEGNTMSLGEVSAVIAGEVVAGKQTEIKEITNAYEAYDQIMTLDPYALEDFLKAHRLMTQGLVLEAGVFRSGDVGVFQGDMVLHIGARAEFVPNLVKDLLNWAKTSTLHPVLKGAIVHYEIETIHPFADGNGRIGRMWQTLILAKYNPIFAWIPMETVMYKKRPQYYQAIENARKANDSGTFIEFTLSAVLDTINTQKKHQDKHQDEHQDEHQVEWTDTHIQILKTLQTKPLSRKEIFEAIGMYNDTRAFQRNIKPLLQATLIEMTLPKTPNSPKQRYRLTDYGLVALSNLAGSVNL